MYTHLDLENGNIKFMKNYISLRDLKEFKNKIMENTYRSKKRMSVIMSVSY